MQVGVEPVALPVDGLPLDPPPVQKPIESPTRGERKELAMPNRQPIYRVNSQGNQLTKALGRRLRYLRAQTGLTQLELGRKASMDRTYISRLERGRIQPRYILMVRLAESLGVSVVDLVRHVPYSLNTPTVTDTARP